MIQKKYKRETRIKQNPLARDGWRFLPLGGQPPNRTLFLWHQANKKLKYRVVCRFEEDFKEIDVEANDLEALKAEIKEKLKISHWAV